jgi:hypothetical protein
MTLTLADLDRWDPNAIHSVFPRRSTLITDCDGIVRRATTAEEAAHSHTRSTSGRTATSTSPRPGLG